LPLFSYLKGALDDAVPRPPWAKTLHPEAKDVQWNFTKFLCVDGVPRKRYSYDVDPAAIAQDIEAFQAQGKPNSTLSQRGKRRVVCLHGTACGEKIFRMQLGKLLPSLQDTCEVIFLEGRLDVTEGPAFNLMQKYFPNCRNCQYDKVALDAKGWRVYAEPERTLHWLQAELRRIGAVDGILGFSQGANFATMLAAQASIGIGASLDFVVLLCPNAPGYVEQVPDLFAKPVSVRALVSYGEKEGYGAGMDAVFDKEVAAGKVVLDTRGETHPAHHVAKLYTQTELFIHSDGHRPLPTDAQQLSKLIAAIKDFVNKPK